MKKHLMPAEGTGRLIPYMLLSLLLFFLHYTKVWGRHVLLSKPH